MGNLESNPPSPCITCLFCQAWILLFLCSTLVKKKKYLEESYSAGGTLFLRPGLDRSKVPDVSFAVSYKLVTYSSLKFCVWAKTKVKFWKYFTNNASLTEGRCEHVAGVLRVDIFSPRLSPRILTVSLHTFPSPASMVRLPPPSIPCGPPWISCPQDPGLSSLSPWGPAPLPTLPSNFWV